MQMSSYRCMENMEKSETYHLRNRTDNFEQGQMDKFKVQA